MNAFKPLIAVAQLEEAGFARKQAEAIATVVDDGIGELVTAEQLTHALATMRKDMRHDGIMGLIAAVSFLVAVIGLGLTALGLILSH